MSRIDEPIIVTDTDDLAKMFGAHLIGFMGGRIGYDAANRFGQSLIEIMRANCPPDVGLPAIRREVALEIAGLIEERAQEVWFKAGGIPSNSDHLDNHAVGLESAAKIAREYAAKEA